MVPGTLPHTKVQLLHNSGPAIAANSAAVVCSHCGRSEGSPQVQPHSENGSSTHAKKRARAKKMSHGKLLRRCCYCRQAVYCSEACFERDRNCHDEMHALRMLFFEDRKISFWNPVDFECLHT